MSSIVCNLIYNNGGEGLHVGFAKTCNVSNIVYNIKKGTKRWCSQQGCSCRQYYDHDFEGRLKPHPCTESALFVKWEWNAGNEFSNGNPLRMNNVEEGEYAVLTTVFAGEREQDRKIVGFFKIDRVTNQHVITAHPELRVRLLLDEAKQLNFWEYYKNKTDDIRWSSSRFRYLDKERVAAILHDIRRVSGNDSTHLIIDDALANDFPAFAQMRPLIIGALPSSINERKRLLERKYGPAGESVHHKQLKEFVARHPQFIGLNSRYESLIEHKFESGDLVDILFRTSNNQWNVVVEIELGNVRPGLHQAIKYRALRCAQLGLCLDSEHVKAVVVAWRFTEEEIAFCNKYQIGFYTQKID